MSRKLFVAGNWKMNMSADSAIALAKGLASELDGDTVDVAVCPPFVYLSGVVAALSGSNIATGAQDVWIEDNGAFTGEISTEMLKDVGCKYVVIGHSERRHVMGESDCLINKKVIKALADGMDVIFCVGELLEDRKADKTNDVVAGQVGKGLAGVSAADMARVTVAYEPVWAIGTGETASPQQAQDVHAMIRGLLASAYSEDVAEATRIQYGGSVKPSNAAELLNQKDIDGALVGGASLKVEDFAGIVQAVK